MEKTEAQTLLYEITTILGLLKIYMSSYGSSDLNESDHFSLLYTLEEKLEDAKKHAGKLAEINEN